MTPNLVAVGSGGAIWRGVGAEYKFEPRVYHESNVRYTSQPKFGYHQAPLFWLWFRCKYPVY